jgi:Cdc6-like AAA superfamily ATPase
MKTSDLEDMDLPLLPDINQVLDAYAKKLGGIKPAWYLKKRPDGPYLIIEFVNPSEHHFGILNSSLALLPDDNAFKERTTVQPRRATPKERLLLPETQWLKKVIAESLTIDKNSFNEDFFSRYTSSVTALETQITSNANFVVYGRRGSGKSSLLAYAMHTTIKNNAPYSWVAMQTYSKRLDHQVVPAVLSAVLYELRKNVSATIELEDLIKSFDLLSESDGKDILIKCDRLIQRTRRAIEKIATIVSPLTIFLDDIHVLDVSVQPLVLTYVYKLTRGNNSFIKVSGIQQLTALWDNTTQSGLQAPHDTQLLNLDLNLTMPDKSRDHIISILNAHASYCGLPSIGYLTGNDALSRLVLAAAGVPRDSLNLFSIAISKASAKNQKLVSVTSINAASSEMVQEKLKDIDKDIDDASGAVRGLLAEVRSFCVVEKRKNAFLIEIRNSEQRYKLIQKLIALRLVHLLHEGITPHEAGRRYIALMLDYGFYVGIRTARSVHFIPAEPRQLLAKELRSLPIFV